MGVFNLKRKCISDHSLLKWQLALNASFNYSDEWKYEFTSFDRNVPATFMSEHKQEVKSLIDMLNHCDHSVADVNQVYEQFENIVKAEMKCKLVQKVIVVNGNGLVKKKHKSKKPWWCPELDQLWKYYRECERTWLKSKHATSKSEVLEAQKQFDRKVQQFKRIYWKSEQKKLLLMCEQNDVNFWKSIGKVGIAQERKGQIPKEVRLADGSYSCDKKTVLGRWEECFKELLNPVSNDQKKGGNNANFVENDPCQGVITREEVLNAIKRTKKGKAMGCDDIPFEVLCNNESVDFMVSLFNVCFDSGNFPFCWKQGIIVPIPKGSTDNRDPLSYRGITLACTSYKLFCNIINQRLSEWVEDNNMLPEEQNGFRKNRSCIDHLGSLTSIIETRKEINGNTFVAFIDFKKAYDHVDRNLLWEKMSQLGVGNKVLSALKGIYENVNCCVKVNGFLTNCFEVSTGLKQGCLLSPLLFNMYVSDLIDYIKGNCNGIHIAGENVCALIYADDLALIASNEKDLQKMLDSLQVWCEKWKMTVNTTKSEIVHFRNKRVDQSNFKFTYNTNVMKMSNYYRYLGLVLDEYLDYQFTANMVAKSAGRALGLVIAKVKSTGGMPLSCFSKLYTNMVLPVIHYGSSIWGRKEYSCIGAIHNRACRFILGVGKYTPNAAVMGDTGLFPPFIEQWCCITRTWCKNVNMDDNRLNKKIFLWAHRYARAGRQNGLWHVRVMYKKCKLVTLLDVTLSQDKKGSTAFIRDVLCQQFVTKWEGDIAGGNRKSSKLRTYCKLKHVFEPEMYLNCIMGRKIRSSYAKFRCGVAPIRIETGRYEKLDLCERLCIFCEGCIEDEFHVLTECSLYIDIHSKLCEAIMKVFIDYVFYSPEQKGVFILSVKDPYLISLCSKACNDILIRRQLFINNFSLS